MGCAASSLAIILFVTLPVAARSRAGYVTLINATPYNWKLTGSHSYQVDWNFPKVIKAGTSHEQYIKFKKDHHDDAAEAAYSLENSPSPASFIVHARAPKHIEVQYQDTLASLNNPEGSTLHLGFVEDGAVSFVLSGDIGSYISSNPPVAWMQATLSSIGARSLREISMPASHDSGMSEVSYSWGGHPHNTQTQSGTVYQQLLSGARILGSRPTYYNKRFYEGHFSRFGTGMVGGTGREFHDVVKYINAFTNQYPGELIILDISHEMDATKNFRGLSARKWELLFEELSKIQALWNPSSEAGDDLSLVPLSTFITPGSRSAVLVRLPDHAPLPGQDNDTHSMMERDIAMIESFARTDHSDGMMPLGPALQGDDSDSTAATASIETTASADDGNGATAAQLTNGPTPSILPPDQRAEKGSDESPANKEPDQDINSEAIDNVSTPNTPRPNINIFPLPESPQTQTQSQPVTLPNLPSHSHIQLHPAFIPCHRLPTTGSYSDTDSPLHLALDQIHKLAHFRASPLAPPHRSTWTITQRTLGQLADVGNRRTSIIGLAVRARRAMLGRLWDAIVRDGRASWPNLLEVDDFARGGAEVTSLCMAINDYFVRGRWESVEGEGKRSGGDRGKRMVARIVKSRMREIVEQALLVKG